MEKVRLFINSVYFSSGLRMGFSIVIPIVIASLLGEVERGVECALGVIAVGLSDSPGSFSQKSKGLILSVTLISITTFFIGWASSYFAFTLPLIFVLGFAFGMYALYGNRAAMIGNAVLIGMTFGLATTKDFAETVQFTTFLTCGGVWYTIISLVLWRIRPFRSVQQAIGDSYVQAGIYIQLKSGLFDEIRFKEGQLQKMIHQQLTVAQSQQKARSLLLTRRSALQGTTRIGRALVLLLRNSIDIHELSMAKHQAYNHLYEQFRGKEILPVARDVFLALGNELIQLGEAITAGKAYQLQKDYKQEIIDAGKKVDNLKLQGIDKDEYGGIVALKNILRNFASINLLIKQTCQYTKLNDADIPRSKKEEDLAVFLPKNKLGWQALFNNMNLQSSFFRHGLRLAFTLSAGYCISHLFNIPQSYWVLLTIVVIMKPSFSVTKKRSMERVAGTVIGGIIAIALLSLIENNTTILLSLLLPFAVGTFSFLSYNYGIGVIFITPFILFLIGILDDGSTEMATIRIADTILGGFLAFIANYIILPDWQKRKLPTQMRNIICANREYFKEVVKGYTGENFSDTYKVVRKEAYLSNANLTVGFQSLLSEPSKQKTGNADIYDFVILNQTLSAHIATLAIHSEKLAKKHQVEEVEKLKARIASILLKSENLLQNGVDSIKEFNLHDPEGLVELKHFSEKIEALTEQRLKELNLGQEETPMKYLLPELYIIRDQFGYILQVADDIQYLCFKIMKEHTLESGN